MSIAKKSPPMFHRAVLPACLSAILIAPVWSQELTLPEVRVQAPSLPPPQQRSLRIQGQDTQDDPAEQLRQVNGVRVMRQAGTSGLVSVQGLSGSRVPVLLDGLSIDGACNHGMDPATSYLTLDSIDRLTVLKGPTTVRHAGVFGGAVLAERKHPASDQAPGASSQAQVGRFGERMLAAEALLNTEPAWARINSRHSERDDYRDGQGRRVPSRFEKRQTMADFGWRISDHQTLSADVAHSNGQAVYPAFHMDGTAFRQDRLGAGWQARELTPWLEQLQLRWMAQRIHHAMDNHSLRPMEPLTYDGEARIREDMVQDVTRRQLKAEAVLRLSDAQRLTLGSHWGSDDHGATNHLSSEACIDFGVPMCFQQDPGLQPYYQVRQRKAGLYAEWSLDLDAWQLTLGSRRDQVGTRTGAIRSFAVNPVAKSGENGRSEHELSQHVARLSWQLADAWRTHLAWGQSQRAPDPIEVGSVDALKLAPETNRELHAGVGAAAGPWQLSLDAFHSRIDDFILLTSGTTARNVQARRVGWELEGRWQWSQSWSSSAAFSRVRADNLSERRPLAQTPPDELRLNTDWRSGPWQARVEWRGAARQDRYAFNQGNTNGLDVNEATPGFSVVNASVRRQLPWQASLAVGVDNAFDRAYVEHINHSVDRSWGSLGSTLSTRVPEPGRRWWVKWVQQL